MTPDCSECLDHMFDVVAGGVDISREVLHRHRRCLQTTLFIVSCSLRNGSEIVALSCGRDGATLRGYTADMAILDQTNFISAIVIDSVIRPTRITRPKARLITISTPWTRDHPLFEVLSKPKLGFKHYTWPTAKNSPSRPEAWSWKERP